jgi:hypothetical protein
MVAAQNRVEPSRDTRSITLFAAPADQAKLAPYHEGRTKGAGSFKGAPTPQYWPLLAVFSGDVSPAPVLPKLEQRKKRNNGAEDPMPKAEMVLISVVEDEWRSHQP